MNCLYDKKVKSIKEQRHCGSMHSLLMILARKERVSRMMRNGHTIMLMTDDAWMVKVPWNKQYDPEILRIPRRAWQSNTEGFLSWTMTLAFQIGIMEFSK